MLTLYSKNNIKCMPITKLAPAKINLFLHITGKRPDGYHNLQTVFRLIDLYDTLTFSVSDKPIGDNLPVTLANADSITDNPADNLIVKASVALLAFVKNQQILSLDNIKNLPTIEINLDKKIPMGAGLGGGSSDCATTLMTLNELWQLHLNKQQLQEIGAKLGADVPIFIFGQDAIAEGIGEVLTFIKLPPQRFLLLKPAAHINTKLLFGNEQLKRDCPSFSHEFLQTHREQFVDNLSENFDNVFESVVTDLTGDVKIALDYLKNLATITHTTPRMTGSGSCVLLPLPADIKDDSLANWQNNAPCHSFIVNTL